MSDATITLTGVEILALKKLALINGVLAKALANRVAGDEQLALTRVLIDIVNRADLAAKSKERRERAGEER